MHHIYCWPACGSQATGASSVNLLVLYKSPGSITWKDIIIFCVKQGDPCVCRRPAHPVLEEGSTS